MPVTTEDRAIIKHMDQPAKDNMLQEQLKRISIAVNSGTLDREAVNNALDHIEVLTKQPENAPVAKPGTLGGPSANPAPGKTKPVTEPAD